MKGIIAALVIHNQMCQHCYLGKPCPEAERLHDAWFDYVAKAALSSEESNSLVPIAA
jgi:hypothetical protein